MPGGKSHTLHRKVEAQLWAGVLCWPENDPWGSRAAGHCPIQPGGGDAPSGWALRQLWTKWKVIHEEDVRRVFLSSSPHIAGKSVRAAWRQGVCSTSPLSQTGPYVFWASKQGLVTTGLPICPALEKLCSCWGLWCKVKLDHLGITLGQRGWGGLQNTGYSKAWACLGSGQETATLNYVCAVVPVPATVGCCRSVKLSFWAMFTEKIL